MNLFCFSLEGSMDSLYEAVQSSTDGPAPPIPSRSSSRSCSRSCSPAVLLDDNTRWRGSGRSISMDMPQTHGANSNKRNRRTHVSKSLSDNETLDNPGCNAAWQRVGSREDLIHITNNHNEEMRKPKHRTDKKGGKGGHHNGTKKKEKQQTNQSIHGYGVITEPKSAAKKNQKNGKKPGGRSGKDVSKKSHNNRVSSPPKTMSPPLETQYLDVPYTSRPDRRLYLGKSSTLPTPDNSNPGHCVDMISLPGGATPTHHQRWSNPGDSSPAWGTIEHTCCRPLTEYHMLPHEFADLHGKEWDGKQQPVMDQNGSLKRSCQLQPKVPRSVTERSTSFGRFEGLRHHSSHTKIEDNGTTTVREECDSPDPGRPAGLGKKMKEISLTMRRKMCKKHAKSLSEETGDDTDKDPEAETESSPAVEKSSAKTSNSLESLYSGQSSSSGITSESNGSSQRDSLKLEEDGSYLGQFCGRARVHTDFVPSPYDTDSLKLKVGDIIHIIRKPPMGIWTGMLNNKVGNFKFIYVDVLAEEKENEEEEESPKIRQQKLCKRPRPKTLLELLKRLNMEEYASALLLNGYQTVEDLLHLEEKHLIELNVKDPEHRQKLLAAADFRYVEGDDTSNAEEHRSSHGQQEEDSDCPRDSGCFIPSECSDTKEDTEPVADTAQA
ncbi:SAM domain-containing protein SAMSN-1a isoform X2 [Poeciliopsis prolifica]|uniref:SAM domain-containing protein SAMSN-1a isoform X2 n=1 Tax=Poeciliopsis prolifica TaxID=188132 RepID=UPI0024136B43|nr:SAM domain-containing protein SAMSN-1a isoform X2 [Poeciliopsis prolifica]